MRPSLPITLRIGCTLTTLTGPIRMITRFTCVGSAPKACRASLSALVGLYLRAMCPSLTSRHQETVMMTMNSDYFGKYFVPADELYDAGEYAQAIAFLEPAFEEFPEHYFKTAFHTLFCYRGLDKLEKCVELIESSVKRGYFFTLRGEILDRVQAVDGGQSILAENERLKAQAQKEAKMRYEVHLPENYTPEKRHPLLLTLHCGGGHLGNIESHRHYWKPDAALERGFIVVYVQSSHVSCSGGYSWDENAEQHRKELGQAYDEVLDSSAGQRVHRPGSRQTSGIFQGRGRKSTPERMPGRDPGRRAGQRQS